MEKHTEGLFIARQKCKCLVYTCQAVTCDEARISSRVKTTLGLSRASGYKFKGVVARQCGKRIDFD